MSAFKDSGHFWWQRCQQCRQAWFIGDKPADVDADVTCPHCEAGGVQAPATRDAALEEAAQVANAAPSAWHAAVRIAALKSRPAERYLPVAKVREVLATYAENDNTGVVAVIAARLGVDLDAKGECDHHRNQDCRHTADEIFRGTS